MIEEFVEDAHLELENALGDSFATSDVPEEYQGILTDMSEISVLNYMLDSIVKKSVTIGGDISINYSDIMNSLRSIRDSLMKRIDRNMDMLGTKRLFDYTEPA